MVSIFPYDPCLPSLVSHPPEGDGWSHEVKWDGYRVGVQLEGGRSRVLTRNSHDYTAQFGDIAAAARGLAARSATIDGEAVVLDEAGISRLSLLNSALSSRDNAPGSAIILMAFDLLDLDGADLRPRPLVERRAILGQLIRAVASPALRMSTSLLEPAAAVFRSAEARGWEGIVSKRLSAPHRAGRQRRWVKAKCWVQEDLVVVGFEPPAGRRDGVGVLLLGRRCSEGVTYLGRLGAGLSVAMCHDLVSRWREVPRPMCSAPPTSARRARWVVPDVTVQVKRLAGEGLRYAAICAVR